MKNIVKIAAVALIAVSCINQSAVTSASKFKPLSEVKTISMDAQNYNTKMRPVTDTVYFAKSEISPEIPAKSKFRPLNEVKAIDMGAQNFNATMRPVTDTIYFENTEVDSPKN